MARDFYPDHTQDHRFRILHTQIRQSEERILARLEAILDARNQERARESVSKVYDLDARELQAK